MSYSKKNTRNVTFGSSLVFSDIMKPILQPKLKVNEPRDIYEQEADTMADRLMRMPASMPETKPMTGLIGRSVQRKCTSCEDEEKKKRVMRKESSGNGGLSVSSSFSSSLNASKGGGSPLPQGTRGFMENAFSTDFSGVRIHADSQAAELSDRINAKAFTLGNEIYFNHREYNQNSLDGKHLLAHELAHVVQQNTGLQTKLIQRGEKWDDFWDVGPWDSYKAKQLADEALSAAKKTGLPGLHNGAADAWRHCYWNCRMTNEIGSDQAEAVSSNHENDNDGPEIENKMDLHNNMIGYTSCDEDCDTCCQGKLDSGQLFVIDESDALHPKLVASSKTIRSASKQKGGGYKY